MTIGADGRSRPGPDRHLVVTSRLRDRRHALGLTQKQVVRRLAALGVGCTNKAVSSLEHGTGIDVGKLPELAAALDCTVTYLLGLTDDPHSWQPDGSAAWRTRPPGGRASGLRRDHGPLEMPRVSGRAEADEEQAGTSWILGPYVPEAINQAPGARPSSRPGR